MFTLVLIVLLASGDVRPITVPAFATHELCVKAQTRIVGDMERHAYTGNVFLSAQCHRTEHTPPVTSNPLHPAP